MQYPECALCKKYAPAFFYSIFYNIRNDFSSENVNFANYFHYGNT